MTHRIYDSTRCHNAQAGTYGHECGARAAWIKTAVSKAVPGLGIEKGDTYEIGYCDWCRKHGDERHNATSWRPTWVPSVSGPSDPWNNADCIG